MSLKVIDYLYAKQDLSTFSNAQLTKLYSYYGIPKNLPRNDKLWYLAISILNSTTRVEFS